MGLKVNLNGKLVDKSKAVLPVFDHAVLYGDGVFEGIRAYNGKVFKLDEHIKRLYDSASVLMLKPTLSPKQFKQEILRTLRANKMRNAYIRPVITRGAGDLGLNPKNCPRSFYFIITDKLTLYPKEFYNKGLAVVTVPTRVAPAKEPRAKSCNYLNNIFAKIEANNAGVLEAIMLTDQGYVGECTGDNIFFVKNGKLVTPPLYLGILEGITRDTVMELATLSGMKVKEVPFTRYDLYTADECFMTGTGAEIIPVVKVDDRTVGSGKPGPWTKMLIKDYAELTRTTGIPIY